MLGGLAWTKSEENSSSVLDALSPGESLRYELTGIASGRLCSNGERSDPPEPLERVILLVERSSEGEQFVVTLEGTGASCVDGHRFDAQERTGWLWLESEGLSDESHLSTLFHFAFWLGEPEKDTLPGRLEYFEAPATAVPNREPYALAGVLFLDFADAGD